MEASGPAPLSPLAAFPAPLYQPNAPLPAPAPSADGPMINVGEFFNDFINEENPDEYRSGSDTPPAGEKSLFGGASAEN